MGNNKELEVCFTGKSHGYKHYILCSSHKSHRQFRMKKNNNTITLFLLWSVNTKHSKRPINPSKVSFISAAVEISEVTYV